MTNQKPVSKVLILDDVAIHAEAIKRFCDDHNLVGLKTRDENLFAVLRSNVDLGAIFLSESYGGTIAFATAVAKEIHAVRPELPIVLRREGSAALDDLPEALRQVLSGAYTIDDFEPLRLIVDEYIFSLDYPYALVRGISEISESTLRSMFEGVEITPEAPCIVRDRIIFGEVFSLIPLDTAWCRGYMMLQAEEDAILDLMNHRHMCSGTVADFRDLNSLLGEATNMIWGAFKNRYLSDEHTQNRSQVQVPLLINHKHKYISFGTGNPQLSFSYRLQDPETGATVKLDQRFAFNLAWSPEDFKETVHDTDALISAGELDLF